MTWNTTAPAETKIYCTCNSIKCDITGIQGLGLVEKLKSIARDNGISKFDILDEDMNNLSPADIEAGEFTGNLTIVRFNAAA